MKLGILVGFAIFFFQALWKKASEAVSLKLLEADGSTLEFNAGPTWFAVIDQPGSVSWK